MIKNYIEQGSETRISNISFSNKGRIINIEIVTKDSRGIDISQRSITVSGLTKCDTVIKIIEDIEELNRLVDSCKNGAVNPNKYFVKLPDGCVGANTIWNNTVVEIFDGSILPSLSTYIFIESTNKYLEFDYVNHTWVSPRIPNCDRFFDSFFSLDKHKSYTDCLNLGYRYLKMLPEFKNCVDA